MVKNLLNSMKNMVDKNHIEENNYVVKCDSYWSDRISNVEENLTLKQAKDLLYKMNKENSDSMSFNYFIVDMNTNRII